MGVIIIEKNLEFADLIATIIRISMEGGYVVRRITVPEVNSKGLILEIEKEPEEDTGYPVLLDLPFLEEEDIETT